MAKIKVSEATDLQLNWLIAKCEGYQPVYNNGSIRPVFRKCESTEKTWPDYCTNWSQSGPIIQRENISVIRCEDDYATNKRGFTTSKRITVWGAVIGQRGWDWAYDQSIQIYRENVQIGPTPLVAAMRCYVASKLGDVVDVPEELI
jgi:hypothetical protein